MFAIDYLVSEFDMSPSINLHILAQLFCFENSVLTKTDYTVKFAIMMNEYCL